jgi:type IV pilus assembly protein PilC
MMKAGVPLLQSFDIVARGSTNPRMTKLLNDIRRRRDRHQPVVGVPQAPAALRRAVLQPGRGRRGRRHPGALLDRLAIYQEKTLAIKSKIKSALMYPIAVMVVAFVVVTVIMIFVIPAFKEVFKLLRRRTAGAHADGDRDVRVLRQLVVGDLRLLFGGLYFFFESWKRSEKMQIVHGPAAAEASRSSAT